MLSCLLSLGCPWAVLGLTAPGLFLGCSWALVRALAVNVLELQKFFCGPKNSSMASRKRWGRRCNDTKPVCVLTGASWVANHPHGRMQAIETPSPRVTVACYIYAATVAMVNFGMANGVAVEGKPVGARFNSGKHLVYLISLAGVCARS